jgi:ADP-ribose pyrophosphatase
MEPLITGPASSGLTSETVTIFLATDLKRVHAGGGIENEKITVHEIPLPELDAWLARKQAEGCLVDPKLFAALYFLSEKRARLLG